jgi:hypothetical protein
MIKLALGQVHILYLLYHRHQDCFFSTIFDGTDFSCSFLNRPKNVVSTDNGLYGSSWVSGFTERIQVRLKFCCP